MTKKIALFGFGTVGKAVHTIFMRELRHTGNGVGDAASIDASLDMIVVRDKEKYLSTMEPGIREIISPLFEDDMKVALQRIPSFDIIIEVIGGTDTAWEIVRKGLECGKKVITANKALLAHYMPQLEKMSHWSEGMLFYEASVAGGIPIIKSLTRDIQWSTADAFGVQRISGILNGTSNYILTEMERRGITYHVALAEAQSKGYAESDPSADVEGWDARAKIQILQRLAYGSINADIVCEGITKVEPIDFQYASLLNGKIKLVATSIATAEGIRSWVLPTVVSQETSLATTNGVQNIVTVDHAVLGRVSMIGLGAGGDPTAHSVVSDVYKAMSMSSRNPVTGVKEQWFGTANHTFRFAEGPTAPMVLPFYVRLTVRDQVGIIADVGRVCEELKISIDAVVQLPVSSNFDYGDQELQFVVTLNETLYETAMRFKTIVTLRKWNLRDPFIMAIV